LIHLPGDAAAETVKYGANPAHQAKYTPEQRPSKDVRDSRLRVRQKKNAPGDKIRPDDDTTVSENQRGDATLLGRQVDKNTADNNRKDGASGLPGSDAQSKPDQD
jgi:hypothetical protein